MRKKHIVTIVLLILVFYHNKTNAQLPPSTNYYFCALNGTCYNDANNNNPRVYLILEEYSQFRRICNPPASNISICNARKKVCNPPTLNISICNARNPQERKNEL
jgi:hypothetical protein